MAICAVLLLQRGDPLNLDADPVSVVDVTRLQPKQKLAVGTRAELSDPHLVAATEVRSVRVILEEVVAAGNEGSDRGGCAGFSHSFNLQSRGWRFYMRPLGP